MLFGDLGVTDGLKAFSIPPKSKPTKGTIKNMIELGKKHMGARYQYGAPRRDDYTASFDCSSYTRYLFSVGRGMNIGMDSRIQARYVKTHGAHRWLNWRKAVPGDLMFFSAYRGNRASDYPANRDKTITHVGLIIGKDKEGRLLLLHTASHPTGVRIQHVNATHLQYRFVSMGTPIR